MIKYSTVDIYLSQQGEMIKPQLESLRILIKTICPDCVESISYGMPAYKYHGKPLIYFAGYKNHIGIYATPSAHEAFAEELSWYKKGKWSVQLPVDKPLPFDLIREMIVYNMTQIT